MRLMEPRDNNDANSLLQRAKKKRDRRFERFYWEESEYTLTIEAPSPIELATPRCGFCGGTIWCIIGSCIDEHKVSHGRGFMSCDGLLLACACCKQTILASIQPMNTDNRRNFRSFFGKMYRKFELWLSVTRKSKKTRA